MGEALAAAQVCQKAGPAGQIVPSQLAKKIGYFAAGPLAPYPDVALGSGRSHLNRY
jgi:hypothetical protein